MGDSFSGCRPIINFFFLSVLLIGMFVMHPVFPGVGFVSAFIYSGILSGWRKAFKKLLLYLPFILIVVLINPMFNHCGVTILFYLDNGNPITLESIVYGFVMGAMLITAFVWFSCYNQVMTSDKFINLFGRLLPSLSLILSMVLRFVPKFSAQIRVIRKAQKCMGRDMSNGNIIQKAKYGIKILSILITWALENAIDTADSIRTLGYGLFDLPLRQARRDRRRNHGRAARCHPLRPLQRLRVCSVTTRSSGSAASRRSRGSAC